MPRAIRDIEDAILALLAPLKARFPRLTVRPYAHEMDESDALRLAGYAPALLPVYSGSRESGPANLRAEAMTWTVFVLARSFREGEASRGGPDQPGAYALLEAVRDALAGQQLFEDTTPLVRDRQQSVAFAQGLAMYAATYGMKQHRLPGEGGMFE